MSLNLHNAKVTITIVFLDLKTLFMARYIIS